MEFIKILDKLNIKYELLKHKAVYTVEEAKSISNMIEGIGCKNLFLTNKKGNYYLYLLHEDKKANLKELSIILNTTKLTFASPEELKSLLGLEQGGVTPLGILNDTDNKVKFLIDDFLVDKKLLMHTNTNTETISVTYQDLLKIINYCKHDITIINTQ